MLGRVTDDRCIFGIIQSLVVTKIYCFYYHVRIFLRLLIRSMKLAYLHSRRPEGR